MRNGPHHRHATQPSDVGQRKKQVLIATLGVEPQVVTLALDQLLPRFLISRVVVLHTSAERDPMRSSLQRLKLEVDYYSNDPRPVSFRFVPIRDQEGHCPPDILTESDARSVLSSLYREVLTAKQKGWQVHLSIAGGRKVMSAYGTAVAQMLFDDDDCLWHLLSEDRLLRSKKMHPGPNDQVTLVPVPVIRWSSIPPAATELAVTRDPWRAAERQKEVLRREDVQRKREFLRRDLTPAEREILELLAREGLPNRDLARRLHRSEKTVANQLTSVYLKFHTFRGYHEDVKVDRGMIIAEFAPLLIKDETL